jgi:hypothetical protein
MSAHGNQAGCGEEHGERPEAEARPAEAAGSGGFRAEEDHGEKDEDDVEDVHASNLLSLRGRLRKA